MNKEQSWLSPEFKTVPTKEPQGPYPQPRLQKPIRYASFEEIYRHPLDLNFRGRINALLKEIESQEFNLETVLPYRTGLAFSRQDESDVYLELVRSYLFPQIVDNRWLKWADQDQVVPQLRGRVGASGFRGAVHRALRRVEHRVVFGKDSISTLLPTNPLFRLLVKKRAHTIPQVMNLEDSKYPESQGKMNFLLQASETLPQDLSSIYLSPENIQRILVGSFIETQRSADELNQIMQEKGIKLDLKPMFTRNLPPQIAFHVGPRPKPDN